MKHKTTEIRKAIENSVLNLDELGQQRGVHSNGAE